MQYGEGLFIREISMEHAFKGLSACLRGAVSGSQFLSFHILNLKQSK